MTAEAEAGVTRPQQRTPGAASSWNRQEGPSLEVEGHSPTSTLVLDLCP